MIFAALMLIGAGGLLFYNNLEENRVEEETISTVTELEKIVEEYVAFNEKNEEKPIVKEVKLDTNSSIGTKSSLNLNGNTYIGIIYVPSFNNLAVPVIDTCTEQNLKISACRYAGNIENNNMVIAGHNYKSLFGKLNKLAKGSIIYFKDLENNAYKYKCTEILTLGENDVEKMQTGNWDLTLFTCTYNNQERLTLRFELAM